MKKNKFEPMHLEPELLKPVYAPYMLSGNEIIVDEKIGCIGVNSRYKIIDVGSHKVLIEPKLPHNLITIHKPEGQGRTESIFNRFHKYQQKLMYSFLDNQFIDRLINNILKEKIIIEDKNIHGIILLKVKFNIDNFINKFLEEYKQIQENNWYYFGSRSRLERQWYYHTYKVNEKRIDNIMIYLNKLNDNLKRNKKLYFL